MASGQVYFRALATPTRTSFRLTGADGGPLRGDVRTAAPARPAIVLCHGFQGFKDWGFFPPLAERLARAGYTAVSFNYSGSGIGEDGESFSEPERFGHNTYSRMHEDLRIVLNELRSGEMRLVPSAIGLLGHSLGGGIALLQTAADPGVRALVTWAGVSRFGRMLAPLADEAKRTGRVTVANRRTGTATSRSGASRVSRRKPCSLPVTPS